MGVCPDPKYPAVVYEYMEEGSLYDHIHEVNWILCAKSVYLDPHVHAAERHFGGERDGKNTYGSVYRAIFFALGRGFCKCCHSQRCEKVKKFVCI